MGAECRADQPARRTGASTRSTTPATASTRRSWSWARDYTYLVDGAELPDPCSRWQPEGIRGPSRLLDPAFDWTDQGWAPPGIDDLVLYELHVGTFTAEGTFEAAIPHLRGLRELGVTAIELMPVAEFPGRHGWGYDGVYLSAAHSAYGGPHGLRQAGRRRPRRGARRDPRRRLQPRRRVRHQGAEGVRPVLHLALRDALGRGDQLRRRAVRRRPRVGAPERRAVGARLPRRRPAARRRARDQGLQPRAPGGRRGAPHGAGVRDRRVRI